MLRATEGLRAERDVAHQECTKGQQQITLLEGELDDERRLKIKAEGVTAKLAMEVGLH